MIKIFNYLNHQSHNYSLWQIPGVEWYILENSIRRWYEDIRPMPKGINFVPYYEPGKYDLAILHLDQQVVDPELGKAQLFRDVNSVIKDIPKIVINHGTPFWLEKWEQGEGTEKYPRRVKTYEQKLAYQQQFISKEVRKIIGKCLMVVNSYRAREQWGWGKVIIHGLDKEEWWDILPKEPRVVTSISSGGLDYYYGRDLYFNTKNELDLIYGLPITNIGEDWKMEMHQNLDELGGYGAYKDFLGRSLIYFNPTKESPMPRARTEAMLSGCCVLTTAYHDADKIFNCDLRKIWEQTNTVQSFLAVVEDLLKGVTNIINGFIVPEEPRVIAALVSFLINHHYREAEIIGQNGRKTAEKMFSKERFDADWHKLINQVLGGKLC